jgi:3-methylfumaryl-CoA hydratase
MAARPGRKEFMMNQSLDDAMIELRPWIGRVRVIEDDIAMPMVRRIAAMLDLDPDAFRPGMALPPHWFSMFFADIARQSDLRDDGHAIGGVVLAGRRLTVMSRLRAAEKAVRRSEVVDIVPKSGRSGNIFVLTLRNTIEQGGSVVAVDEFDAIYREATPPGQKTTATVPAVASSDQAWTDTILLSEALVFRYSAVTWNSHRIHYDADYARSVEGYEHTVQNGGLTMQLMIDAALKRATTELRSLTARLTYPVWVGDPLSIRGTAADSGRMRVWVADKNDNLCGEMDITFA